MCYFKSVIVNTSRSRHANRWGISTSSGFLLSSFSAVLLDTLMPLQVAGSRFGPLE